MPLDDMLKVLGEEGAKQRRAVREKVKKEVEEILEAAREEGERIKKEQIELVLSPLEKEKAKILNEAKLEVKKRLAHAKKDLLQSANTQAREKIEKLRHSPEWFEILKELLTEASQRITGKIVVKVDQRDEEMARRILQELGAEYHLEANSAFLGGATITSEDGRVTFINTFDSRLERANQLLKPIITSTLFGEGDGRRL